MAYKFDYLAGANLAVVARKTNQSLTRVPRPTCYISPWHYGPSVGIPHLERWLARMVRIGSGGIPLWSHRQSDTCIVRVADGKDQGIDLDISPPPGRNGRGTAILLQHQFVLGHYKPRDPAIRIRHDNRRR